MFERADVPWVLSARPRTPEGPPVWQKNRKGNGRMAPRVGLSASRLICEPLPLGDC